MSNPYHEYLRLLEQVRREQAELKLIEQRILDALGDKRRNDGIGEKAVKWLLAMLVEKPVGRLVDMIFHRLERRRRSL